MTFLLKKNKIGTASLFCALLFLTGCSTENIQDFSCAQRCDYQNQLCSENLMDVDSPSARTALWSCEKRRAVCKKRCQI